MQKTGYGFSVELSFTFEETLEKTIDSLKSFGFGVLTEIDVKEILREKLGADFKEYRILGVCNPPTAHKALSTEKEIGLLLPCNVIVYEVEETRSRVAAIDPVEAMKSVGNPDLEPIATAVRNMLEAVLLGLSGDAVKKG